MRTPRTTAGVIGLSSLFLCLLCLLAGPAGAEESKSSPELSTGTWSALSLRSIGPALMSGRIADLAIDPEQPHTWYVAVGSGNLWKTENAGTTWQPIFENYGSYSIGCLALDPHNRHTLWVGTGENVGGRHVGYGDGIYVSRDGGTSFQHMGLRGTEHISKIVIDPRDTRVIYVAAQGPLWSSGGERGLYKSTDGGQNWHAILTRGPWTGVTDIAMDPSHPDTLYAALHQRHRTVWGLMNGGPESGIVKSTDAGRTWQELKQGLPSEDKGKIAVAVSPLKHHVVYAAIELPGRTGGVWRSEDFGASWRKMSDYVAGGTGPHYYQELYCDPHRFDVFYHANVRLGRTEDGGKTFRSVGNRHKHVDNHAVAFHPTDKDFLLVGCDGGLYCSRDYAGTFQYLANLPLTQFYKLDVDYDEPFYHIVGGTQDNATQYGPSRTDNNSGIRNSDWRILIGGDGHDCAIDPEDPNIIYCESQEGYLRRFDRRTGESVDIRPQPAAEEVELRFNWDAPILISPHARQRLYFGSSQLHRSDDRGDSWVTVSPDLSRNVDRFSLPHMGRVWSIDATYDLYAMSQYGTISSISESPLVEGLIYVGTDDGLVQVTEDGGQKWRAIDKFYGVPRHAFVNDIKADRHDANTVYAVFDNHKEGDFQPYVARSRDRGVTWELINGNLPDRHVTWRIEQDHVQAELLFLGTEFGIFYSPDGGQHWIRLPGSPAIPFRDLAVQRRENDLIGASFGRGFFVLDDYTPLRFLDSAAVAEQEFLLFPVRTTRLYIPQNPLGGEKGSQGDAFFTASNPPFGALLTYYLRDSLRSKKSQRQQAEAKLQQAGDDNPPPDWDALKTEETEEAPDIALTIQDAEGHIVRRLSGPAQAGTHRLAWDLRYGSFTGDGGSGPLVLPGTYTVTASRRQDREEVAVGQPQSIEVVAIQNPSAPQQDRQQTLAFQQQIGELWRRVLGTQRKSRELQEQLDELKTMLRQTPTLDHAFYDRACAVEEQLRSIQERLSGDNTRQQRSQLAPLSIVNRVQAALQGTLRQSYGPTATHRAQLEIGTQQHAAVRAELRELLETRWSPLLEELHQAGAPWTPGRPLP